MRILFCAYRDWALEVVSRIGAELREQDFSVAETAEELDRKVQEGEWEVIALIGWSWKVPAEICNRHVVIGMHPSDLPKFAGGSPIQNQILAGVTRTKATLFRLNEQFDRGAIIDKEAFSLEGHLEDVFEEIGRATYGLLKRFIDAYPNNLYTPQPDGERHVVRRLKPEDSRLPLIRRQSDDAVVANAPEMTCRELWDFIRCREDPYPNAFFEDQTGRLVIKRVEFLPKD
jgi:methionyl-tRNA formyltransferase